MIVCVFFETRGRGYDVHIYFVLPHGVSFISYEECIEVAG